MASANAEVRKWTLGDTYRVVVRCTPKSDFSVDFQF